jgi:hypothetical protein
MAPSTLGYTCWLHLSSKFFVWQWCSLNFLSLADKPIVCQPRVMEKKRTPKPKAKSKPKRPPKEDFNQAAARAVRETIKRSES